MARIQVARTTSGYMPTLAWGEGEAMQRETYAHGFDDLAAAERAALRWAEQEGAEYVPHQPVDAGAVRRHALLVKRLREEEGLSLPDAVSKARALEAREARDGA